MLPPVWRLLSVSVARGGLRSYPLVHSASGQCAGSSPVSSSTRHPETWIGPRPARGSAASAFLVGFRSRWCFASCLNRLCAVV
jgi:hypothetical protein